MRRGPRLRVGLAWVALIALPFALSFALAYALSLSHYRGLARDAAEANAARIGAILQSGEALLDGLERSTGGRCSEQAVAEMARVAFESLYFREAGIERDGRLACTSLELLDPPVEITTASRPPSARFGRIEVLAPTATLQGGKSIILNLPLAADRSHFINLLLDPQVLVELLDHRVELQSSALMRNAETGGLTWLGEPVGGLPLAAGAPGDGISMTGDGVFAVAHPDGIPIYTVIAVPHATIDRHWRTQMQPAVAAGFALSLLALLLLRRYLPREGPADDLRAGIAAGELVVWYQPIVDTRAGTTVAAEALIRWQHPRRGLVMPDEFIPLAEQSGLVLPMTAALLATVQRDLKRLEPLPAGFRVHVNLATAHLSDAGLLDTLDQVFGPGASLHRLGFEITERELLANPEGQAREVVRALRQRGGEVSLDDFGTGYSGLAHLRHLPLHHIKIDRSFVWAIDTEAVTASLVDSIVMLAQSLGLGVVAEGVETVAQRDQLVRLGVYQQQGWLHARAMPIAAFAAHLAALPEALIESI